MILLTIDSEVEMIIGSDRLDELRIFNEKWEWLKEGLKKIEGRDFVTNKSETSFFVRIMQEEQLRERVIMGHIIDHPPMMNMEWQYEDKVVENSQGGTTHIKGWHLE